MSSKKEDAQSLASNASRRQAAEKFMAEADDHQGDENQLTIPQQRFEDCDILGDSFTSPQGPKVDLESHVSPANNLPATEKKQRDFGWIIIVCIATVAFVGGATFERFIHRGFYPRIVVKDCGKTADFLQQQEE